MKTQEEIIKHRKKQNIIAGMILILGTFFAYTFFGAKNEDNKIEKAQEVASLVKVMTISDDSSKVARLEKTVSLSASGVEATAISEFSGRIKIVSFEVGDRVIEGQTLAVFDQSTQKNSPKVSLESAEKNYQLTKDNLEETKELVEKSIDLAERAVKLAELTKDQASTGEKKDLAEQSLKIAKDQKKQAEVSAEIQTNGAKIQLEQSAQGLQQAKIGYEKTIIKAPISGVVSSKKISQEDFLSPGQVVAEIVGAGKVEALLYLNQEEISRIKENDSVEIVIDGESYDGKIDSYSKIANESNGRFEVKIVSADNISGNANQTAQVLLNIYLKSEKQNSFFVPLDAVNIGQTKKEVFVIVDGKAKAKNVKLGKIIGTQIEILSGLEDGDVLVIENSRNLQDGQVVKISNS
jgi:RND family efflux transporter MFP subunit